MQLPLEGLLNALHGGLHISNEEEEKNTIYEFVVFSTCLSERKYVCDCESEDENRKKQRDSKIESRRTWSADRISTSSSSSLSIFGSFV